MGLDELGKPQGRNAEGQGIVGSSRAALRVKKFFGNSLKKVLLCWPQICYILFPVDGGFALSYLSALLSAVRFG